MKYIYIVEDNIDIGWILDTFLTDSGFKTLLLPTVSDFHSAFAHILPDLFILDLMLPDGNGMDVCKEIKADSRSAHLPVLIMSAHQSAEKLSLETAADGFIAKPFDLNDVLDQVRVWV